MNTIKLSGSLIASLLFSTASFAQSAMNFDKIKIAGSAVVELRQGEVAGITNEDQGANNNIMNFVSTSVDGWLVITGSSDDIIVTANQLNKIDISGSGKLESNGAFNTNEIDLRVTGAGKMDLSLQAKKTNCVISGSGKIELEGTSEAMEVDISGSGKIDAENFKVKTCTATISGSGKCLVDVTDELTSNISGSGSVYYVTKPTKENSIITGGGRIADVNTQFKDTTRIVLGKTKILIVDGEGRNMRFSFKDSAKTECGQTKSHWAGFEMGVNMLMDNDFSTTPPKGYEFLEPRIEKSIALNLNLVDLEMKLYRRNIMLVTGLGFSVNNFRFKSDAYLAPNVDSVAAVSDPSISLKKNKLVVGYLNVPLLLEFNTSQYSKKTAHLAVGVIGGLRIGSHVKMIQSQNGEEAKVKIYDNFNLNPIKCDATVRLGYRNFTVFASYGLLNFFKNNSSPELAAFNTGVKFIGW